MERLETTLDGPVLMAPVVHGDERGFFLESYRANVLAGFGIEHPFVQDNHSRSARAIVRGMHFQPGQAKLVRCVRGAILDVLVDIRPGTEQFGRWEAFTLDDVSHRHLYVPDGFAHGFCVLSEVADVAYKTSAYYDPETEGGFQFDDPEVAIDWPQDPALIASARDRSAPSLAALEPTLRSFYAPHS